MKGRSAYGRMTAANEGKVAVGYKPNWDTTGIDLITNGETQTTIVESSNIDEGCFVHSLCPDGRGGLYFLTAVNGPEMGKNPKAIYHWSETAGVKKFYDFPLGSDAHAEYRALLWDDGSKILYMQVDYPTTYIFAFDCQNTTKPELLKTFTEGDLGGNAGTDLVVYNSDTTPIMPTGNFNTSADIEQDMPQTPAANWSSITINITLPDGTKPAPGIVFYVWVNIISLLSVAANLAEEIKGPYVLEAGTDGKMELNVLKLKDTNGNAVSFPGVACKVTCQSKDGKFSVQTGEVRLAAAASKNTTSGGGCDAGFVALAIALMASILLRKR
ncbi:MAG: hypothetical protein K6E38_03340 [Fretibacterium sp.]|nr:hypothetical protein [Fretibacterium sp.]